MYVGESSIGNSVLLSIYGFGLPSDTQAEAIRKAND